jgi:hypothetical protein
MTRVGHPITLSVVTAPAPPQNDDGYRLWLRYDALTSAHLIENRRQFREVVAPG